MEVKEVKKNEKIVFFDKKSLEGPLSQKSRYIEHLADTESDTQGIKLFAISIWIPPFLLYCFKQKSETNKHPWKKKWIKGVILPNGEINWGCPCLGTASIGPCAIQFRTAFQCFHFSEAELKGSDCVREFEKLQECMKQFPKLYK